MSELIIPCPVCNSMHTSHLDTIIDENKVHLSFICVCGACFDRYYTFQKQLSYPLTVKKDS